MLKMIPIVRPLLLAAVVAGALAGPAWAEMEVTASTATNLSVGVKLPDDTKFDIGEGEMVRVIKAGKTYEIAGPYKGTLNQYQSTCPWWQDVLGKCSKHSPDTGAIPGATRGIEPIEMPSKSN